MSGSSWRTPKGFSSGNNSLHRCRLLARKEMRVRGGARRGGDLPFREAQVRRARGNRHSTLHHPRVADLGAGVVRDTLEASPLEIRATNTVDTIYHASISIYIRDTSVRNVDVSVDVPGPAVVSASPPRAKHLVGTQRTPADIAHAEARPAPANERHQPRRPVMPPEP